MHDEPDPERCIEWIRTNQTRAFWSVSEYDREVRRGRSLSNSNERGWSGLLWTEVAPMVEGLTLDGQWTVIGTFRICDIDTYIEQIRELIGLT